MTSPSRFSLVAGASLFVGCTAASQDAAPRAVVVERAAASTSVDPARLPVTGHVRPRMKRHAFDFFALPSLEAASTLGRSLKVEKTQDESFVLRVDDTIGTLLGAGDLVATPERVPTHAGPECGQPGPSPVLFEGLRRSGWSNERVSFVEWSGAFDRVGCALHPSRAREVVAEALLPGLVYAARSSGGGPRHALYLLTPQAAWYAAVPSENHGSYVHAGTFTFAALALEMGESSSISLSIPVRALWAWNSWRAGGTELVDDLKLSLEEEQLELFVDISWPTNATAPRAVLLASDEPRFAQHRAEEKAP